MAASSSLLTMSGSALVGGVGSLPERRAHSNLMSTSSCVTQLSPRRNVLRQSSSLRVSRGSKVQRRLAVVSQQGSAGDEENSKVFKSMKDATERRKEEMYGSLDDVEMAKIISDAELLNSRSGKIRNKPVQPPRFATLRAFGEAGGNGVVTGFGGTSVFELLAASIEASKQVRNWEVLSGRLAMLALSIAIGVEFCTGNSVFEGVNLTELQGAAALCAVATVSAASFAYAWRAKADVVSMMSRNYKTMMDSALDNLIDGLFFDESK
ncbi:hypothetical protein MPTK1_3g00500 [Marchantia polymorpha subsp. ruderalis]|uniref:Uncharacterized protein n=2 Tax=Marchantia polymorpha TaxID=3197 RepID=A0AAF6AVW9_MARPO|nr:hypothetical protein MARPO_0007s0046 [Marchantia polymorpha]BBN03903.1 hypothetical protein Mp_3g00500 [Marchantia polymorpha subsp. ruderalis]|eukprot:PTQ47591.1 hypothetical protein MARPO_0007s0046 [Marchantia polymorpha]